MKETNHNGWLAPDGRFVKAAGMMHHLEALGGKFKSDSEAVAAGYCHFTHWGDGIEVTCRPDRRAAAESYARAHVDPKKAPEGVHFVIQSPHGKTRSGGYAEMAADEPRPHRGARQVVAGGDVKEYLGLFLSQIVKAREHEYHEFVAAHPGFSIQRSKPKKTKAGEMIQLAVSGSQADIKKFKREFGPGSDEIERGLALDDSRGTKWDRLVEVHPVYSDLEGGMLLLASVHHKGRLVASVGFSPAGEKDSKKLFPELVYVDPEYRRQGLASAMYRAQFDGKVDTPEVVKGLKQLGIAVALVGGVIVMTLAGPQMMSAAYKLLKRYGGRLVKWAGQARRAFSMDFKSTVTLPQHGTLHVEKLNELTKTQRPRMRRVRDLVKRSMMSTGSGFSRERMLRASDKPVVLDQDDAVLDGRHRLLKAHFAKKTHYPCVIASPEQIAACRTQDDGDKSDVRFSHAMDFEVPAITQPGGTLTKRSIANAIAEELDLAQMKTLPVVQATLDKIAAGLMAGQRVELRNFGIFEMKRRRGRVNRDPRDQSVSGVQGDQFVVRFRPSKNIHRSPTPHGPPKPGWLSLASDEDKRGHGLRTTRFALHVVSRFQSLDAARDFVDRAHSMFGKNVSAQLLTAPLSVVLHLNMPDYDEAKTPGARHLHTHEKLIDFVMDLAAHHGGRVMKVTDSTKVNSMSHSFDVAMSQDPLTRDLKLTFPDDDKARAYAQALLSQGHGSSVTCQGNTVRVKHSDEDAEHIHALMASQSKKSMPSGGGHSARGPLPGHTKPPGAPGPGLSLPKSRKVSGGMLLQGSAYQMGGRGAVEEEGKVPRQTTERTGGQTSPPANDPQRPMMVPGGAPRATADPQRGQAYPADPAGTQQGSRRQPDQLVPNPQDVSTPGPETTQPRPEKGAQVVRQQIYFDDVRRADLAQEWLEAHGVKVKREFEGCRTLGVVGPRKVVNYAYSQFRGNPVEPTYAMAYTETVFAKFETRKKAGVTARWLQNMNERVEWGGNQTVTVLDITPDKWSQYEKMLRQNPLSGFLEANARVSSRRQEEHPESKKRYEGKQGKELFTQFVVDFGSTVVQHRAMQKMAEKGVLNMHEDDNGLVAAAVRAVSEATIRALVEGLGGKILQWRQSKDPNAPPISSQVKSFFRKKPKSPWVDRPAQPSSGPGSVPPTTARAPTSPFVRPPSKKSDVYGVEKKTTAGKRKPSKGTYSFAHPSVAMADQFGIAYAVMDLLSDQATRAVIDYLVAKGIRYAKRSATEVVAKCKEADLRGLAQRVRQLRGKFHVRRVKGEGGQGQSPARPGTGTAAQRPEPGQANDPLLGASLSSRSGLGRARALAQTPEEKQRETEALLKGHKSQVEKHQQAYKDHKAAGRHEQAAYHAKKAQQHVIAVEQLAGKGQRQPSGKPVDPFDLKGWQDYYTQQAYQRQQSEQAHQKANQQWQRSQRINKAVSLGFWALIIVPLLIRMGIAVYKKGKEWFAVPKTPEEAKKVQETVEKVKRQRDKRRAASLGLAQGDAGFRRPPTREVGMALPALAIGAVYAIEGIAALLSAAVAVKQLNQMDIPAKVKGKRVLAKARNKKEAQEIAQVASKVGGHVRKASTAEASLAFPDEAEMGAEEFIGPLAVAAGVLGISWLIDKGLEKLDRRRLTRQMAELGFRVKSWRGRDLQIESLHPEDNESAREAIQQLKGWFVAQGVTATVTFVEKKKLSRGASMGIGSAVGRGIGGAIGRFVIAVSSGTAKAVSQAVKRLGGKILNSEVKVTAGGIAKTVMTIEGTRQIVKDVKRLATEKDASMAHVRMGWKTDVWTVLGVLGGAAGAAKGGGGAAVVGGFVGGLMAYLQARGVEAIYDPRAQTITVPKEDADEAMRILQDKNVKVRVKGEVKKPNAASMSHAAARMMRRSTRRQERALALSAADENFTQIIQVLSPDNCTMVLRLAKESGLDAQYYFEGRVAVTGKREAVLRFVDLVRDKVYGEMPKLNEDIALAHDLDVLCERLDGATPDGQRVRRAYQDMTSLHPVAPARKKQYRALADELA